jgi:acyl-CoA oxidase
MTTPSADELVSCNECVTLAPLLYVAWADGALEPDEVAAVRAAAAALEDLSDKQRAAIDGWLDPEAPPSSTELLRLFRLVRQRVAGLDAKTRGSLVDVGLSLAKLNGGEPTEATHRALSEVEQALGLVGSEIVRELFATRPPVAQHFVEPTVTLSAERLTAILDGDYAADWQRVRRLLVRPEFRNDGKAHDQAAFRERVASWIATLVEAGLGAVGYPESVGGEGRMDGFVEIFEALGMFDLSLVVKFGVQFGLFGGAIFNLGSERHHRELLGGIGRAEIMGGFAMTELGHGSNVRDLETVARYEPERGVFVLHSPSPSARKEWIGNAAVHGRVMVVFAQLEVDSESHGVHAFVVPVRDDEGRLMPGVGIEDCGPKMGLNGVDNGRIRFDHVEVPRDALLDRYGRVDEQGRYDSPIASPARRFFTMLGTLVGGRIGVGATSITASKTALAIAIRYGALRRQFGPAGEPERCILDYRTHQQRLFPRLAATYALHFAITDLQAAWRDHLGDDMREVESLAAGIKAIATWHAIDSAQQCRECCGGMGFSSINRIAEIRKDVDVFATFEGDNVVLLQLVAKGLLTGYAKAFQSDLVGTVLGQMRRRAAESLLEKNPFTARWTNDDHLRAVGFHRQAFAFRTSDLMRSAAARVKTRTDRGMDGFDAVMDVQDHLVSLAIAHVEERIHASFAAAVEAVPPGAEHDALERMRSLYAVWRLHEAGGWFMENGYLEPNKARALRKLVGTLCSELRPLAIPLVDGFGIPDEVLEAPIAFEGYAEPSLLNVPG